MLKAIAPSWAPRPGLVDSNSDASEVSMVQSLQAWMEEQDERIAVPEV